MKKGLLVGVAAVAAVIVVAVVYVVLSSGDLIKAAVEKFGSEATRAEVTLDAVDLDLTSGKGALKGFVVGNPSGFKTPSAFKLGSVSIHVDAKTLAEDPVVIKEITVNAPEVTYELGDQGSNVDALQRNVDAYVKKMGGGSGGQASSSDGGGGPKLVIENLWVRGGKANVSASILQGESLSATLPDIHLKDIGKDQGGATPADVAKKVMDALNQSVGNAMASIGVGKTLDSLKTKLGGAAEAATKAATGAVEDLKSGAAGGVQENVGQAGESLKKLFGN